MDVADSFRDSCEGDQYITTLRELKTSPVICSRGKGGIVYFVDEKKYCITTGNAESEDPLVIIKRLLTMPGTMVLCRTNKQVRKLQAIGIQNCSTVHQAKGLEYDNVILCDIFVNNEEELNVAYVGMTRAKNELCVINFDVFVAILSTMNLDTVIPQTKNTLF